MSGKKLSQRFIDNSINEWRRVLNVLLRITVDISNNVISLK